MKANELRILSSEELDRREDDLRQELFQLKLQKASDQLTDTARVKRTKQDLARVMTVKKEAARGGGD